MSEILSKEIVLITGFLAILAAPAVIQTAVELRRSETIQALNVFRQVPTSKNLREYEREMEDASYMEKELRPWIQYAQFRFLQDAGDKALIGRNGWMFYKPGARYLTERPLPPKPGTPSNNPLPAIVDFRDQLALRGIGLLVMIAPNKESIYPQMLSRRAENSEVLVGVQTRQLLDGMKAAGIEVVDLFEVFRAARLAQTEAPTVPLYLAQDSHWSPAGVELAANAVAQRILDAGWVQRGTVAYDVKSAPVRRLGDIIRMLQVPQLEKDIIPETIPCQKIVRQGNQSPYRDDPDAEILVLGDSFLRIYEQDEPQSAGFLAHLAYELRQPVTSIVNDGGASTLVRQELFRRPRLLTNKKLVIWEFVERDIRFGAEGWQLTPLPAEISWNSTNRL
jgi:SGNH hydrolase-like domain, acetyltransferase AlgX